MYRLAFLISFQLILSFRVSAQGCSDAGFCTVSGLRPQLAEESTYRNQLKAGINFGAADHDIKIWGSYVEYDREISDAVSISAKITSLSQQGNGISVTGLSDIFLNANVMMSKAIKLTGGVKLPLTNGNRSLNGLPLPMDYQSSLGTIDAISGVSFQYNRFIGAVAFQIPLTQNSNAFQAEAYPPGSPLTNFQSTAGFTRKADILARISYAIRMQSMLTVTPGLLPIYHMANDEYVDAVFGKVPVNGSQGLTLNATVYIDYAIGKKSALQLNAGAPLIVRDARPDGLTRSFIATVEYAFKF